MDNSHVIAKVLNARLGSNNEVEFHIQQSLASGDDETVWVSEKQIARRSLRSKLFRRFYATIPHVYSIDGLRSYFLQNHNDSNILSQNNLNQNNSLIDIEDNNDDGKVKTVKIKIGETTQIFAIKRLKLLSYFQAMFSDRWLNHRKNNNMNNNSDENDEIIDVCGNDCGFECKHVRQLLRCVKAGQLRLDVQAKSEILDPLIACHDFFMNKEDAIITVESLINYFKSIKPLTVIERRNLLNTAKNDTLKKALSLAIGELNNAMEKVKQGMINNISDIKSLGVIKFDEKTAIMLLNEKLKFRSVVLSYDVPDLCILFKNNFTKSNDYISLWNQCNWKSGLIDIKSIGELINTVEDAECKSMDISISPYFERVVEHILRGIANNGSSDACNMDNDTFESEILRINKVRWIISHQSGGIVLHTRWCFNSVFTKFSEKKIEEFLTFVLEKHDDYIVNYVGNEGKNAVKYYYKLIQDCVLKCSKKWLGENAHLWFPIVHKADANSVVWIMKDIVGNMNAQDAFTFGIYLTQYIVYQWESKKEFPDQYMVFLRDHLGITWELNAQN